MGQARRNRGGNRWVPNNGRGRHRPHGDASGLFYWQPSQRRYDTYRRQPNQQQRRQRGNQPKNRNRPLHYETLSRSSVVRFQKLKAPADTRGIDYEERTLALAFLRCLRHTLRFHISSNNEDAGKFDDLVVRWYYNNSAEQFVLMAQLKHKAGSSEVVRAMLLPDSYRNGGRQQSFGWKNNFSVPMYQDSYRDIKDQLQTPNFTLILSTNAPSAYDTRGVLYETSTSNVPGAEFLDTGGTLYALNSSDRDVRRAVNSDFKFIDHFAIFCNQKDSEEIKDAICREIELLLAPRDAGGYIYENLCREIREWKRNEQFWLSGSWDKWTAIVKGYTERFVCQCGDKSVRPPISFTSVESIRKFVDSHNPALIAPLRRSTTALTASKVHQAVGGETHILLTARRYRQLRPQVLRLWERFCKWLVILDDGVEDDTEVLVELTRWIGPTRRLIFVTSRTDRSFLDTFGSSEVCDESWGEFLAIRIKLNGDNYRCSLSHLVGDLGSLKKLLHSRPEDVVTLSQSTGTLDMGQQLDPVPDCLVSRRVVVRRCVTENFFLSLGEKDVCIINQDSYTSLPHRAWKGVTHDLRKLEIVLGSSSIVGPLLITVDDADRSVLEEISGRYPDVSFFVLSYCDDGWQMLYFSGHSDRITPYINMQEKQAPDELDLFKGRVILEGPPAIGKYTMLAAIARYMKGTDPAYWIVKVNFSEFYNVFENCDDSAEALEHVLIQVTGAEDQLGHLQRTLLQYCLQNSPHVICLVDGFDELISDYTDLSLNILKKLAPYEGAMVVAARPTAKKYLEETLGSMACLLTTFSDTELQMFQRKYCPTFTGSISSTVENAPRELLRLPLFCKMRADLAEHELVSDATELYNLYFRKKCETVWVKKQGTGKQKFEEQWKSYEEQLMYLAMSFLVQRIDRLGQRPYNPISKDFFVEAGIMHKTADGRLVFVHRTFAEYFLAKWCFARVNQQDHAVLYQEALTDKNLEFFTWTFDRMACKGHRLLELIVDGNESDLMQLLNSRVDATKIDAAGRNALHLATLYSEPHTVLQRLCERTPPRALEARDDLLHWTPLRYAVELGHWPTAAALVRAGAQVKQLGDLKAANYDFNELKNYLPKGTFQKFLKHLHFEKGTDSSPQSNKTQNKDKIRTSSMAKQAPINNSQQQPKHWIKTGSFLQSDEWQSTAKSGKPTQAGVTSQPKFQNEKGAGNGFKRNEGSSTKKPEVSSAVEKTPNNNPQLHAKNGKSTDSNLQTNVGKTTTTPALSVEATTDPSKTSPSSASSQKSCWQCCCQFSILSVLRAVFCCSSRVRDNCSDHGDSTENQTH